MSRLLRLSRLSSLAVLLALLAAPAFVPVWGQDWAKAALEKSPRHREYVAIPVPGTTRTVNTFVVYPEVSTKAPVVVLIHEIFGLSDWMKLQADEFAAKGYIVLAPDLLSGLGPVAPASKPMAMPGMPGMACDPMPCKTGGSPAPAMPPMDHSQMDHANMAPAPGAAFVAATPGGTDAFPGQDSVTKAVMSLPPAQVTADLNAVSDYAEKIPSGNGKLAVGGFCWGGCKTFDFATHRPDLKLALSFYGPPPPAAAMAFIAAPVYGFYAGNDMRIGAMIPQATTDMKAAGKFYEPVTYAGAGHGFMRAGQAPDATPANKKAFEEAFARATTLLEKLK